MAINVIERSELIDGLEDLGFELVDTGGGCVAYAVYDAQRYHVLVTGTDGIGIPSPGDDVLVGRYDGDNNEIELHTCETLEAALASARDFKELLE